MALPSQVGQGGNGSRVTTSTRRERGGRTVIVSGVLLLVAAAALTWIILRSQGAKLPSAAQPTTETANAPAPASPLAKEPAAPTPKASPKVEEPPVSLLSQGAPKPGAGVGDPGKVREPSPTPSVNPAPAEPARNDAAKPDTTKPVPTDLTRTGNPVAPPGAPGPGNPSTPPAPSTTLTASSTASGVRSMIEEADRKLASDPIAARTLLSRALADPRTTRSDQDALREKLTRINDDLIFSTKVTKGEPFTEEYTVQAGDNPTKIFRKRDLATEPKLIEKLNKTDATRLRVGQKLKLVRGPFHGVVHKSDFRLDIYAGSPDDQADWVYIRSFQVGLGENNSTPVGTFVVKSSSKLINPPWTNPKTGEKFLADDPKNPIGERWIGIEGVGAAKQFTGFGLHGTVDPDSIGKQRSMGCVRMNAPDVEMVYDLLTEKISIVKIEP